MANEPEPILGEFVQGSLSGVHTIHLLPWEGLRWVHIGDQRFEITPRGPVEAQRPRIVCLVGSSRFYEDFEDVAAGRTLDGEIVVSTALHIDLPDEEDHAATLEDADRSKVLLADYVYVINPGGYIGHTTRSLIEYAEEIGKPIEYLEEQ